MHFCLFVYLFIYSSTYLFIYQFIYLFIYSGKYIYIGMEYIYW